MHVYKLINLCTCVCRSYTSGCRQNAEEEEKKKGGGGRVRKGTDREVEIKKGLEEGLGGRRGKGGRKEERGRRKHMDLFKNTAIYQSQAHSESIGASKVRKKKKKD